MLNLCKRKPDMLLEKINNIVKTEIENYIPKFKKKKDTIGFHNNL